MKGVGESHYCYPNTAPGDNIYRKSKKSAVVLEDQKNQISDATIGKVITNRISKGAKYTEGMENVARVLKDSMKSRNSCEIKGGLWYTLERYLPGQGGREIEGRRVQQLIMTELLLRRTKGKKGQKLTVQL